VNKFCVAYTCVTQGHISDQLAARFVATFHEFSPGHECDVLIICNGGPLRSDLAMIFAPLTPTFFARPNDGGFDVSGYMDAARGPCALYDSVFWCGESIYFHREGWLKRLVEVRQRHGPGIYGPFGSFNVRPHLQTSAFFCPPGLVIQYPERPNNRPSRMNWEHGERSFWRRTAERAMPVRMVTFDGDYEPRLWRYPQNILWRGDQSALLCFNNHAQSWEDASPLVKFQWSNKADGVS
jgi:hypothetical protein